MPSPTSRSLRRLGAVLAAAAALPAAGRAQDAAAARAAGDSLPPLAVGWGVDTTAISPFWGDGPWRAPLPAIYRSWRAYLATRRERPGAPAPRTRSPYWNAAEQARWPEYDLAASVAYQGLDRPGAYRDWFGNQRMTLAASGTMEIPANGYRVLVR